jgi:tellurite resistance protein TerC
MPCSVRVTKLSTGKATMDLAFITIILQLIFLECILSIDNAAVLGAMVAPLPNNRPVPWPRTLRGVLSKLDPLLGPQRQAALKVGLIGAYAGRVLMLFLASMIIQNVWMQILGAAYLIYLAIRHFGETYRHGKDLDDQVDIEAIRPARANFWNVVVTIELADLAFSLDNVIAAVALSDKLWIVIFGVAIGIVMMRFAAQLFTRLIAWEPALEHAAYLLLFAIGGELLLEYYLHFDLTEWAQFGISIAIIVLVVLFARVKALRRLHAIFQPFAWLFALINDALSFVFRILAAPFRQRHREIDEAPPHWPATVPVTTKDAAEEQR